VTQRVRSATSRADHTFYSYRRRNHPRPTVLGCPERSMSMLPQAQLLTKVEFYVDGVLNGSMSSGPYSFPWNTDGFSGSHSLISKAYDAAGGQATSAPQ